MARSTPNQYPVRLTPEQRERFEDVCSNGHAPAKKIRHARLLLLSDHDREGGAWTRTQVAEALGMHPNSVDKVRKRFVLDGEAPALERKARALPPRPPILDGRAEAHLVAICCGPAPEGRTAWTLQLLADEMVARGVVTQISADTVGRAPKKNELQPWRKDCWCIPEKDSARFVAQLEDVLDVYAGSYDDDHVLVCMDEASKQLLRDEEPPVPMAPGRPLREDYHYDRRGTQAVFMFFDPVRGWRRASSRDSRTRADWAEEVRRLLEEDYPNARKVTLVCDNLNTHSIASLYEAFPAEQASALRRRLELRHTPRNGSWLNVAEIELSILSRQCLDRRIGDAEALRREIEAWAARRNAAGTVVKWRFTVDDARVKLHRLYPQF
ncbi:MAG: IS630 family transposase [Isosphaeraceae bacterium]